MAEKKPQSIEDLGIKLKDLLASEAAAFVKDNTKAVAKLGEDAVRAIFQQEVVASLPGILPVSDDARLELIVEAQTLLAQRAALSQLVAKAEAENAELVRQVRANAVNVAGKVAGSAMSLLGGFALKFLLGA